jgi:transposase
MSNRSRLSRGDRRRNDRLAALRAVVTRHSAVLAFDLAADKQVCALTDQDSRVLARRTVSAKAWQLAEAVEWGVARAAAAGFSSVVVACEPTGHRWRVLDQIAAGLGVRLVCVQPLLVHRARESEDFTRNKSDETDAMIIARLVTELRCYLPERAEPAWARLRHLGARRAGLVTDTTAARQQITDLLECAWPAALEAAGEPMKAKIWLAAMTALLDRVGTSGDLTVIRRWGWSRFAAAVRREVPRHGATRWYSKIVRAVFDAATDPTRAAAGVANQRAGALERTRFALARTYSARSAQ